MSIVMGQNASLARNGSTFGSPSWASIGIVRDVRLTATAGKAEATTRGDAVKTYGRDLPDIECSFKLKKVPGNADYDAIKAAWLAGSDIDLWVLDGPLATVGSAGPRGNWIVTSFGEDQAIGAVIFNEVTIAPSANSADAFDFDKVVT